MQLTGLMRAILYRGTFLSRNLINQKTIMTTPNKMQEVLDELKGNPYYSKYEAKIKQLQQSSSDQFTSKVDDLVTKKSKVIDAPKERQYSQLLNPKEKKISPEISTKDESLAKIMKTDLIQDKTAKEITEIWLQYHLQKDCIAATIPNKDFEKLEECSTKYPIFLFPLPRSQGYEFIMCQFEKNTVHFTPLLYYQVHKENAPECLTIFHYKEFKDSKGIILMRGEYDQNILTPKEAQCLANQLQMFYIQNDEEKKKLLEAFSSKPDSFDHMDLVKQLNKLSL